MSSGWPVRPSGMARARLSYSFWLYSATWASSAVSVGPGHTQLTVIPWRAISRASVFVNAMTPPLVAEYTASPDDPTRPASEAMFTMRPYLRSIIASSTARLQLIGPLRLTAMMRSHSSSVESTNGLITSMPALLTRMSGGPAAARTSSSAALTLAEETRRRPRRGPCRPALPPWRWRRLRRGRRRPPWLRAAASRLGDGGADAARGARDEGHPSVEVHDIAPTRSSVR